MEDQSKETKRKILAEHMFFKAKNFTGKTMEEIYECIDNFVNFAFKPYYVPPGWADRFYDGITLKVGRMIISGNRPFEFFFCNDIPITGLSEELVWSFSPSSSFISQNSPLPNFAHEYDTITQYRIYQICQLPFDRMNVPINKNIMWEDIKRYSPKKYKFFWDLIFVDGIKFDIHYHPNSLNETNVVIEFKYYLEKAICEYEKKMLIAPSVYLKNMFIIEDEIYDFEGLLNGNTLASYFKLPSEKQKEESDNESYQYHNRYR